MSKKKHLEKLNSQKLNTTMSVLFFIAMEDALLAYIASSFLQQYVDIKYLGYIFVIGNIISAILILKLAKLIVRFGRYKVFFVFFVAHLLSLIGLAVVKERALAILFFLSYSVSLFVIYIGIDIFVETFSCDDKTGRIKGKQLTVTDLAWIAAPIISGYILAAYGFKSLFFIAAIISFLAFAIFIKLKGDYVYDHVKINFLTSLQKIKRNKNLSKIMLSGLWIEIFFAFMVIYMPLHLLKIGMKWPQIGLVFTIMLAAFLIFQYPAGWLADNKYGEKEILMFGFILAGTTTCLIFFINSTLVWVWGATLFINRIGASLVQVMNESYFYKQIDGRDFDLINFFLLSRSFGFIIMPIVASIILIFYPLQYIFLFLGIFMLAGLFVVGRIEDAR
ncbi:MAG: MFS transporter [bacterium]